MPWAWRSSRAGSTCASGRPPAAMSRSRMGRTPNERRSWRRRRAATSRAWSAGLRAGDRYGFRLDDDPRIYPDPASRSQPDGPHGLSAVVDPRAFAWTDGDWRGVGRRGQVIYELHVGTFTRRGDVRGGGARAARALRDARRHRRRADAGRRVRRAVRVGIRRRRSLGARRTSTGRPTICAASSTARTRVGLGVILDVVYNHLGPDGNYLNAFAPDYFTDRTRQRVGRGAQLRRPAVRGRCASSSSSNAGYWIDEFHFDGLRLDATQRDPRRLARARAGGDRPPGARGGRRRATLHRRRERAAGRRAWSRRPKSGGYGLDALWNDDFHHAARVALTGRNEAYYRDYLGRAAGADLGACAGATFTRASGTAGRSSARGTPGARSAAERFVHLPREPRPGREHGCAARGCGARRRPADCAR